MPYRVTAPLVLAHDASGRCHHHYRGELIKWLAAKQEAHFLELGLVEVIETDLTDPLGANQSVHASAAEVDQQKVADCVQALAILGVNAYVGAPAARRALRESSHRFSNGVIAAAVRERSRRDKRGVPDT